MVNIEPLKENVLKLYRVCRQHYRDAFALGIVFCVLGVINVILGLAAVDNGHFAGFLYMAAGFVTVVIGALTIVAMKHQRPGLLAPTLMILRIDAVHIAFATPTLLIFGIVAAAGGAGGWRVATTFFVPFGSQSTLAAVGGVVIAIGIEYLLMLFLDMWLMLVINQYRRVLQVGDLYLSLINVLQESASAQLPVGSNATGNVGDVTKTTTDPA